eukprot:g1298.t1
MASPTSDDDSSGDEGILSQRKSGTKSSEENEVKFSENDYKTNGRLRMRGPLASFLDDLPETSGPTGSWRQTLLKEDNLDTDEEEDEEEDEEGSADEEDSVHDSIDGEDSIDDSTDGEDSVNDSADEDGAEEDRLPSFIPSKTFQGRRKGYAFKRGSQGNGYYIDSFQNETSSKKYKKLSAQVLMSSLSSHLSNLRNNDELAIIKRNTIDPSTIRKARRAVSLRKSAKRILGIRIKMAALQRLAARLPMPEDHSLFFDEHHVNRKIKKRKRRNSISQQDNDEGSKEEEEDEDSTTRKKLKTSRNECIMNTKATLDKLLMLRSLVYKDENENQKKKKKKLGGTQIVNLDKFYKTHIQPVDEKLTTWSYQCANRWYDRTHPNRATANLKTSSKRNRKRNRTQDSSSESSSLANNSTTLLTFKELCSMRIAKGNHRLKVESQLNKLGQYSHPLGKRQSDNNVELHDENTTTTDPDIDAERRLLQLGLTGGRADKRARLLKLANAEIYDDSPFYSALLKTVLHSNDTTGALSTSSRQNGSKTQKTLAKEERAFLKKVQRGRKAISDELQNGKKSRRTKVSKGRTLMYIVQEKLVNFMAPEELEGDREDEIDHMTDRLVRSLFRS